ncbi:MAG: thiol-disulfide oxidoreductase DCC family protein [Microscillaceae bacterium]
MPKPASILHSGEMNTGQLLVLFDGVCNLCNHTVDFIIRRDRKGRFKFASLQSDFAQSKLGHLISSVRDLDSVILIKEGKVLQKSSAALEIARHLRGLWPALLVFKLVPRFIRDGVYDWIARNRYRWFGKKETCRLPSPEEKARFLG